MMQDVVFQAGPAAFGDGGHPTTQVVLAALEEIDPAAFAPACACDMGAGSGILSFAIAARFGCRVWAVEISAQAVEVLQENIASTGLDERVTALQANGFAHPQLIDAMPFDLIVMNILAEPLLALAHDAARSLASEGVLILSGLLRWQEEAIREAYVGLGLEYTARLVAGDWVTLVFQKP